MQKLFLCLSPGKECLQNEICVKELDWQNCIMFLIPGLIKVTQRLCAGHYSRFLKHSQRLQYVDRNSREKSKMFINNQNQNQISFLGGR